MRDGHRRLAVAINAAPELRDLLLQAMRAEASRLGIGARRFRPPTEDGHLPQVTGAALADGRGPRAVLATHEALAVALYDDSAPRPAGRN